MQGGSRDFCADYLDRPGNRGSATVDTVVTVAHPPGNRRATIQKPKKRNRRATTIKRARNRAQPSAQPCKRNRATIPYTHRKRLRSLARAAHRSERAVRGSAFAALRLTLRYATAGRSALEGSKKIKGTASPSHKGKNKPKDLFMAQQANLAWVNIGASSTCVAMDRRSDKPTTRLQRASRS